MRQHFFKRKKYTRGKNLPFQPIFIHDNVPVTGLPLHFRTTHDRLLHKKPRVLQGLTSIRASGSGQFSPASLLLIQQIINNSIIIVDLRSEIHGFVNGEPVSYAGPKNYQTTKVPEEHLFSTIKKHKKIIFFDREHAEDANQEEKKITIKSAYNEKTLCERKKIRYSRLPVVDQHIPLKTEVTNFIQLIEDALLHNLWIHFHCHEGKGRTTTFMIMYDMLMNAPLVKFEDIVERQKSLANVKLEEEGNWNTRKAFLQEFYDFSTLRNKGTLL